MCPLTVIAPDPHAGLLALVSSTLIFGFFWTLIVTIATWAFNLFKAFGLKLIDLFRSVGGMIQKALGPVWDTVKGMGGKLWQFWKAAATYAKNSLEWVLKELPKKLTEFYQRVRKLLDPIIKPIIDAVQKVIDVADRLYQRIVLPILIWMDRARVVLKTLDKLGVDWAGALEKRLWKIENGIYSAFQAIRTRLNDVIWFLNQSLDPMGLIRRQPFVDSLWRVAEPVVGVLLDAGALEDRDARRKAIEETLPSSGNRAVIDAFRSGELFQSPHIRDAVHRFRSGTILTG